MTTIQTTTAMQNTHKLGSLRATAASVALLTAGLYAHPAASAAVRPPVDSPRSAAQTPTGGVYFEPNVGQSPAAVRFVARGAAQNLVVTDRGFWLRRQGQPLLELEFAGAATLVPSGVARLPGVSHYRVGDDARRWRSDVPHFERLTAPALYPGVDLVAYAHGRDLEYDLVVAPGADPAQIRLRFAGAERLTINRAGDLVIDMPSGKVKHGRPFVYQTDGGAEAVDTDSSRRKHRVGARYRLLTDGTVAIALEAYDRRRPLVIDPVLSTTKRLGGSGSEQITDIALDGSGNVYVTGYTEGSGFPTLNPAQGNINGDVDAFVSKYNAAGTLVFSTFYGGEGEDIGRAIAVDGGGRAYVVGATKSRYLPVVRGYQAPPADKSSFLLVLASGGNSVAYSSYLGGSSSDAEVIAWDVAVGTDGYLWATGQTTNTTFPFTPNGFQTTHGGGRYDAFVLRVNPSGSEAPSFTFYGGDGYDIGRKLVRRTSDFLIGGESASANLRVLRTFGTTVHDFDAFVLAVPSAFTFSGAVRLVGIHDELVRGLGLDGSGNIYVSGESKSDDLPVTGEVTQRTRVGSLSNPPQDYRSDVFVAKLDANANNLVYLTYLGGRGEDVNSDLAVTKTGLVYVSGTTYARDFPVTPSAIQTTAPAQRNGFLTKLDAAGARVYSTYLGGSLADDAVGVVTSGPTVWVAATSESSSFPGASAGLGSWDGLLTKLTASALFVVGSTTLNAGDTAARNRLNALGFSVTTKTGSASTSADANGKDLILISASVLSGDVNTKFKRSAVGLVNLEDALQDDLALTSTTSTEFGRTSTGQTQLTLLSSTDPLSAGLFGNQTVVSAARSFVWGRPTSGAIKVATLLGDATRHPIYRYEAGATMFGTNSDGTPFRAAARRVGFFVWEDSAQVLTTAGGNLFDAAIRWAAGW